MIVVLHTLYFISTPYLVVALKDVPHLTCLLKPISHRWKMLGTALEIANDRLEEIERTGRGPQRNMTVVEKMNEVLLRAVTKKVTYGKVCEAIKLLDNNLLAGELEEKYKELNKMDVAGNVMTLSSLMLLSFVIVTDKDVPGLLGDLDDIADQWKMFGTFLEVENKYLKRIAENVTCDDLLWEMLIKWIELQKNGAMIVKLISAVRGHIIRNESLAQNIAADDKVIKTYGKAGMETSMCKIQTTPFFLMATYTQQYVCLLNIVLKSWEEKYLPQHIEKKVKKILGDETIAKSISAVRGPIVEENKTLAQNIAADDTVIKRYGSAGTEI